VQTERQTKRAGSKWSDAQMAEIRRGAVEAITGKGPCWWNLPLSAAT
jgi:hypothetical protein